MTYGAAVGTRWDEAQVLALAPDASGAAAGQKVARGDAAWVESGADAGALWGRCAGSGSSAYRVVVDLTGPAFRCSCPSRKFPCKHALALLLRWARASVPDATARPDDVADWLASRRERSEKAARPVAAPADADGPAAEGPTSDDGAAARRVAKREARVAAGLDELERWLHDQVRSGLAAARRDGPAESARVAARLVDAQAPGAASLVRDLPWAAADDRWPERVLAGLARLHLLVRAGRTAAGAPPDGEAGAGLAQVVRSRTGWSTPTEQVLARPGVTDRWLVLWQVDEPDGHLITRRTHVHGTTTGRDLLVLAWGAAGQAPDTGLVPGTVVDADLHVHPGRPLRAVVGERRGAATAPDGDHATGARVVDAVAAFASALAADPWLHAVPVVLDAVRPARTPDGWAVVDADGAALPLAGTRVPLDWLAHTGGHPAPVAGELTRDGLVLRAGLEDLVLPARATGTP